MLIPRKSKERGHVMISEMFTAYSLAIELVLGWAKIRTVERMDHKEVRNVIGDGDISGDVRRLIIQKFVRSLSNDNFPADLRENSGFPKRSSCPKKSAKYSETDIVT